MNDDIKVSLSKGLGAEIKGVTEVMAGNNNRLFLVETGVEKYLLKIYFRDERNRLNREFSAFEFLRDNGFVNVPKPFLKNDALNFALYSYEEGIVINSAAASPVELDLLLDFIIKLEKFNYEDVGSKFEPAVMACFELQDYLKNIQFRFVKFRDYVSSPELHPLVEEFVNDIRVVSYIEKAYKELEAKVSNFSDQKIIQKDMRLSPVDFGFHNALFKPDKSVCFVDFEYFGWDDPSRIVADFVNHDMQLNLADDHKDYFMEQYIQRSNLDGQQVKRLYLVRELIALEWLTIYLYGMTPEKLANKEHSSPNYNVEEYLDTQIGKIRKRYFQ